MVKRVITEIRVIGKRSARNTKSIMKVRSLQNDSHHGTLEKTQGKSLNFPVIHHHGSDRNKAKEVSSRLRSETKSDTQIDETEITEISYWLCPKKRNTARIHANNIPLHTFPEKCVKNQAKREEIQGKKEIRTGNSKRNNGWIDVDNFPYQKPQESYVKCFVAREEIQKIWQSQKDKTGKSVLRIDADHFQFQNSPSDARDRNKGEQTQGTFQRLTVKSNRDCYEVNANSLPALVSPAPQKYVNGFHESRRDIGEFHPNKERVKQATRARNGLRESTRDIGEMRNDEGRIKQASRVRLLPLEIPDYSVTRRSGVPSGSNGSRKKQICKRVLNELDCMNHMVSSELA